MKPGSGVAGRTSELRRSALHPRGAEQFAIVSRDELWVRGALLESRLLHGQARFRGDVIEARDTRDEALLRTCDESLDAARTIVAGLRDARIRIVARAVREDDRPAMETTMSITIDGRSVVTTPADAIADYALLCAVVARTPVDARASLPIVWLHGSASVLLHEAVGHAAEEGAGEVAWPEWLSVDTPLASRRATFRDVPQPRMTHVIARQVGAPFVVPEARIEVMLIGGGAYDPLTDMVTIHVAASTCGRFTIRRPRSRIAAALRGATGEPIRYPGVICSREGQELYVTSHAPVIITDPLT